MQTECYMSFVHSSTFSICLLLVISSEFQKHETRYIDLFFASADWNAKVKNRSQQIYSIYVYGLFRNVKVSIYLLGVINLLDCVLMQISNQLRCYKI